LAGHAPANQVKRLKLEVKRSVDVEVAPVQVIPRGTSKPLTATQRIWLRRRQAVAGDRAPESRSPHWPMLAQGRR